MLKRICLICLLAAGVTGASFAENLTIPIESRPGWLAKDGIVMAGSWEPLLFRVRRDGGSGYEPTAEQREGYRQEQSPEMVAKLKAMGVNFIMMHCYKGGGLQAERESMADAVRFSELCHSEGLRVGVYNYSGAFIWELFFKEMPQAKDWLVLDESGNPRPYYRTALYRYFWNRNHPDAQAFYKGLVRFAVEDIKTDLVHFDNYDVGPGREANSVQRFREYLKATFSEQQLQRMGVQDVQKVEPAMSGSTDNPLRRAWLDFARRSLAQSYHDMSRYARTLRPDILMECNPGGPGDRFRPPVDHGLLCQGGEAFWDEGEAPGYREGRLHSRIRTYKIARRMNNIAFAYATTPLEMAESMAFNLDSLGCICWFEYGKIVNRPGETNPVSPSLQPFIRFFHNRRDLLRSANVVADVAVLRSFPSQVFGGPQQASLTAATEQALIENRVPFQIIHEHQLDDLRRYRALVLAGCPAMSDQQVRLVRRYVERGGRLCILGPAATHDEWMWPRSTPGLDGLAAERVRSVAKPEEILQAVRDLCPDGMAMSVDGPVGLCAELTEQGNRRLVHLVNYRTGEPAGPITVRLRVPEGKAVGQVALAVPGQPEEKPTFTEKDGVLTVAVPSIDVYGILTATWQLAASAPKADSSFLNRQQHEPLAAAPRITDLEHSVIHYDPKTYCGHPRMIAFKYFGGGEMVLGHYHAPCRYQVYEDVRHICYQGRASLFMQRSLDGGKTWPAEHDSQIAVNTLSDEDRMAFLFPTDATREKYDMLRPEAVFLFNRTHLSSDSLARQVCFSLRSANKGRTWERVPSVIAHPQGEGMLLDRQNTAVLPARDGRTLLTAFHMEKRPGDAWDQYGPVLMSSKDQGLTWQFVSCIAVDRSRQGKFGYEGLLRMPNGDLHCYLLHFHDKDESVDGLKSSICLAVSSDDGRTWSDPVPISGKGAGCWRNPRGTGSIYRSPWPMLLKDGRILVVFARRRLPAGIGGIISSDNGRTWSEEFVIRDDGQWWDLGYPVGCQLEDGRVFLAYYFNKADGNAQGGTRYIAGSHFRIEGQAGTGGQSRR